MCEFKGGRSSLDNLSDARSLRCLCLNRKTQCRNAFIWTRNKWIDLARANYGRADGAAFTETLNVVQTAVSDGRVVLPMSAVHIMETVAPEDPARRRRLAEFIVGLSGNQTIATHMIIMKLEIQQAVMRKLGHQFTAIVRPFIVQDGLYGALDVEPQIRGVPDHIVQEVLRVAYLPETSVQILCEAVGRQEVAESRRQQEEAVVQVEEARRRAAKIRRLSRNTGPSCSNS